MEWLAKLADRIAVEPRFNIGRPGDIYLQRWTLYGKRTEGTGRAIFLHRFLRSDSDDALHDHPWPFVSVILSGGYYEHTPNADGWVSRRWYAPGRVLTRPATYRHRVELRGGESWSLVFRGMKAKSWSFFCLNSLGRLTGKSVPWRSFVDRIDVGALGCGES